MDGENKKKKLKINIKDIGIDKLVLIVIAGIVLVICSIPSKDNSDDVKTSKTEDVSTSVYTEYEEVLEEKLTNIIKSIDGAGDVKVMITFKSTSEKVVKEDSEYSKNDTIENDSEGGNRQITDISSNNDTVYTTDENGDNIPYIVKEIRPQIEGVAVIVEGGDNPVVKTAISETVNALFGISANKISVSKMKK